MRDVVDSINGIEASRRVGWAKYYSASEEVESLREALVELAEMVIFDPRVRNSDPVLSAAQRALTL